MPKNFGQAVSGLIAARKRPKKIDPGFSRGILPSRGIHEITKANPQRDAGGETHPKVLLPGKKYGASGKVVQDPNIHRIEKRNARVNLTGSVSQGKENKFRGKKKQMVMHYLSGNR